MRSLTLVCVRASPVCVLAQLCAGIGWRPDASTDILFMTFDLNLTSSQQQKIVRYVCEMCVPLLGVDQLPHFSLPLLVASAHGHREIIVRSLAKRILELDDQTGLALLTARQRGAAPGRSLSLTGIDTASVDAAKARREFESAVMTTLLRWESAVKLDQALGTQLIDDVTSGAVEMTFFVLGMLLQMAKQTQWMVSAVGRTDPHDELSMTR
jgi:hypothetical protein